MSACCRLAPEAKGAFCTGESERKTERGDERSETEREVFTSAACFASRRFFFDNQDINISLPVSLSFNSQTPKLTNADAEMTSVPRAGCGSDFLVFLRREREGENVRCHVKVVWVATSKKSRSGNIAVRLVVVGASF